jgi:hypothetical protein
MARMLLLTVPGDATAGVATITARPQLEGCSTCLAAFTVTAPPDASLDAPPPSSDPGVRPNVTG